MVNGTLRRITEPLNRRCANSPSELAPREGYEEQACLRSLTTAPKDPHDRNGAPLMTLSAAGQNSTVLLPRFFSIISSPARGGSPARRQAAHSSNTERHGREKKKPIDLNGCHNEKKESGFPGHD